MKDVVFKIQGTCPQLNKVQSISLTQREDYIEENCKIYGHSMVFAKQYVNNELTHVLPFTLVKAPILGKKLVSMPFDGSFGGIINLKQAPPYGGLYQAVKNYARQEGIDFIEIRSRDNNQDLINLDFKMYKSLIISELKLSDLIENKRQLRKGHRAAIKYASRNGLYTTVSKSFADLRHFYQIMSINMRQFATPMYPWSYFNAMWKRYGETDNLVFIKSTYQGEMVSGIILLINHDIAIYKYGASLFTHLHLRPYQAMLWKAIEISIERGCRLFNMGTSFKDDSGLISFKKGFGAASFPLLAYTYSFKGRTPNIDEYLLKFGCIKKLWKYQPIITTQLIGKFFWRWFC